MSIKDECIPPYRHGSPDGSPGTKSALLLLFGGGIVRYNLAFAVAGTSVSLVFD
jgi:hypothetical protein